MVNTAKHSLGEDASVTTCLDESIITARKMTIPRTQAVPTTSEMAAVRGNSRTTTTEDGRTTIATNPTTNQTKTAATNSRTLNERTDDNESTSIKNDKSIDGFFENVDTNKRLFRCLANLAQSEARTTDQTTSAEEYNEKGISRISRSRVRVSLGTDNDGRTTTRKATASTCFMKLTKKMKTLYVLSVMNDLKNQTVKFNVKKLFQIWLVYHRDDQIVKSICDIVFKNHTYDISKIREDIIRRNQKLIKTRKQRDDNCREISENNELLRIFDKKCLNYCLKNFHCSIVELKKKIPTILCFNESDIDHIIDTCRREKNFPLHFLPTSIALNVHYLLTNRVPPSVVLASASGSKN